MHASRFLFLTNQRARKTKLRRALLAAEMEGFTSAASKFAVLTGTPFINTHKIVLKRLPNVSTIERHLSFSICSVLCGVCTISSYRAWWQVRLFQMNTPQRWRTSRVGRFALMTSPDAMTLFLTSFRDATRRHDGVTRRHIIAIARVFCTLTLFWSSWSLGS